MIERKAIPASVRYKVFARDRYTCQYCHRSGVAIELDHKIPVADGGSNEMSNLVTACVECNRGKRDLPPLPGGLRWVKENKSARMQLLVRPCTREGIKKLAEQNNQSMNDYINDILEKEIRLNGVE